MIKIILYLPKKGIVMKRIMCRLANILAFELPLEPAFLAANFSHQHLYYKNLEPNWNFNSTRRKVISQFWLRHVSVHFGVLLLVAITFIAIYNQHLPNASGIFIGTVTSFFCITSIFYYPQFYRDFLPVLDTIIGQQESLQAELEDTKKCKRTQFSTPTLTIIYYVLSKTGDIQMPGANDAGAALLNNLFGVDKDKLKQNLVRLLKLSELSARERAEFIKGISAARDFFTAVGSKSAGPVLNQLELKVNHG
ncbi:hypothetical protein QEG73_12830 [Chitinophagaceae bacterium 26-R-25]|nr:hypothetical protein [Chitinophagaceae bacterium 26-R-25]